MFSSKSAPHKSLLVVGIAGLVLWFLIPTISNALDVNDKGALADSLWLIQTAVGFGGIIALVAAARIWRSRRTPQHQSK